MKAHDLANLLFAENPDRTVVFEVEGLFLEPVKDISLIGSDKIELIPQERPDEEE